MFKHLIFFTLILFIQNNDSDDKKSYLKEIYNLFINTNIISNFENNVNSLNEPELYLGIPKIEEQIKNFGFKILENDVLEIKVDKNKDEAIDSIKNYIYDNKIRLKGKTKLGNTFTNEIIYNNYQWNKYDLLVSQGRKIKELSVFTKKINKKYVSIYFASLSKLDYEYGDFILINKSINQYNPFNNLYSITQYDFNCVFFGLSCSYDIIASGDNIKTPYAKVLVQYYSILSYYVISQELPANFNVPFNH